MADKRIVEVFRHESGGDRPPVGVGVNRTTTVRVMGARPLWVAELDPGAAFDAPSDALVDVLRLALERPDLLLLVAAHGADAAASGRRARATLALLRGDADAWVGEARASGAGGGDLRTRFARQQEELARRLGLEPDALAARREALQVAGAVGCGAAWPPDRARIKDHVPRAAERVDVLLVAPEDAPLLACHASGSACEPKQCDLYRKAKYRRLLPPAGEPLAPHEPVLAFRVVNARGLPVPHRRCTVELAGGERREAVSDAEGWVRLDVSPHAGAVRLDFPEEPA